MPKFIDGVTGDRVVLAGDPADPFQKRVGCVEEHFELRPFAIDLQQVDLFEPGLSQHALRAVDAQSRRRSAATSKTAAVAAPSQAPRV